MKSADTLLAGLPEENPKAPGRVSDRGGIATSYFSEERIVKTVEQLRKCL